MTMRADKALAVQPTHKLCARDVTALRHGSSPFASMQPIRPKEEGEGEGDRQTGESIGDAHDPDP